jgi:hypothetical protein
MNLFLAGHGFSAKKLPALKIPAGFTIAFYCKDGTVFDSAWESAVLAGDLNEPVRGKGDWDVIPLGSGKSCSDHLLTRPGNMQTTKPWMAMKEIKTNVSVGAMISQPLVDGDVLCIKGGGTTFGKFDSNVLPYTYLSDIMIALTIAMPGGANVHWCACRSEEGNRAEVTAQARDAFRGVRPA